MLSTGPKGFVVNLGAAKEMTALCMPMHLADAVLDNVALQIKKFKPGQTVKCRVLSVDVESRRVLVSFKPKLVKSSLAIVNTYDKEVEGKISHGFITAFRKGGIIVTFYGNVHGIVPTAMLRKQGIMTPKEAREAYSLGQIVKCRIVSTDMQRERMTLSFRVSSSEAAKEDSKYVPLPAEYRPGQHVSGKVIEIDSSDGIMRIKLGDTGSTDDAIGIIEAAHTTDHAAHAEDMFKTFRVGDRVQNALVIVAKLRRDNDTAAAVWHVHLTLKPLLLKTPPPAKLSTLQPGQIISGYVVRIESFGVFVRALGRLTFLAPKANLADKFVTDPEEIFVIGQTVQAWLWMSIGNKNVPS